MSHGCIRMRNADIVRLARALPVGIPADDPLSYGAVNEVIEIEAMHVGAR